MFAREDFKAYFPSFASAIGVHVLVALLMVLGTLDWKPFRQPQPVGLTIEAVIVDTGELRQQREEAREALKEAERREEQQQRRQEQLEAQKLREEDARKRADLQAEERKKLEAQQQRQKALDEQKRKEQEEARRKKEAQDKLAELRLEREKKLQEEREKQERELEQVREAAAAAEKERQKEAERLKQLEAVKQAQDAEKQRLAQEAERQKQQAAEEQRAAQAGRIATLADEYIAAIQALVRQNWLRPPTARAGLRCTLKIAQIPGGEVISAAIAGNCNADEATRRSIIAAVERVENLPYRGYEEVFEREIDFIFKFDGD